MQNELPINRTPQTKNTVNSLWRLEKIILDTLDFKTVVQRTVDSILTELDYMKLGYRIIVLVLLDKETNSLKRIAISQTPEGKLMLEATPVPFKQIEIPLSAKDNLLIKVLAENKPSSTTYWPDILEPSFTRQEAIDIQNLGGIKTSLIYPVNTRHETTGVMIFSLSKSAEDVSDEEKDLIAGFTDIVGLAVQNSQLYTSLEKETEQFKNANEKLKQLDKMKDDFITLASHELRTPMTAIQSYIWMLLNQQNLGTLNDKQRHYMERTLVSTQRLIKFVNEMLNVSRIESGRFIIEKRPSDLIALAQDTLTDLLPAAQEKNITIAIEKPPVLPHVFADPNKIKEVYVNLIGNSLKFTPSGGKITISFSQADDEVTTHVTDTGRGIKNSDCKYGDNK